MKKMKVGDEFTANVGKSVVTGILGLFSGEEYLFTNHKTKGTAVLAHEQYKGYKRLLELTEVTNVKVDGQEVYIPIACGWPINVINKTNLEFGCGDICLNIAELKAWVAARNKNQKHDLDKKIEDIFDNYSEAEKLSIEDAQRIDFCINSKVTPFAAALHKAINTKLDLTVYFKHGDYFSAILYGENVSGRVSVVNGKQIFCHNDGDIDECLLSKKDAFGYSGTTLYSFSPYREEDYENVTKSTKAQVDPPLFIMTLDDEYVVEAAGANIIFGCGEVKLTKKQILNWLEIHGEKNNTKIKDYLAIEAQLSKREVDFDDLDKNELKQLVELCKE